MLLREFTVEDHLISLVQENDLYIAKVINNKGERLLYNEYKDYERIKSCFDKIVQAIEIDKIGIAEIIGMLEKSSVM
jgi:hypothetical protein